LAQAVQIIPSNKSKTWIYLFWLVATTGHLVSNTRWRIPEKCSSLMMSTNLSSNLHCKTKTFNASRNDCVVTTHEIKIVLLWCVGLNYVFLLIWVGVFVFAHDWAYRLHGRWFKLSVETFDAINSVFEPVWSKT
jgi:hypothetical protein